MTRCRKLVPALVLMIGVSLSASGAAAQSTDSEEGGEELEQAALDFVMWCGPCHGRRGEGNGPIAAQLQTSPPDLTEIQKRAGGTFPTDMIRARIDGREQPQAHGTQEMPAWGYWFNLQATGGGLIEEGEQSAKEEVQARIDQLVLFLQTLQK